MRVKTSLALALAGIGALLGLIYSGYSTADFVAHLDRQLHPVSCSFTPGLQAPTQLDAEASGCKVAMFSTYSSFWRDRYWGGIPWSLFAVGLFAFALALALWGLIGRQGHGVVCSTYLLLAGLGAVGASVAFFYISLNELRSFCTLCVGTYVSSALLFIGAVLTALAAHSDRRAEAERRAAAADDDDPLSDESMPFKPPTPATPLYLTLLGLAVVGVEMLAAVLAPAYVYSNTLPSYDGYVKSCGEMDTATFGDARLLPVGRQGGDAAPTLLVMDPLCAACKAFHERMTDTGYADKLSIRAFLLPLDAECNWMIQDSMHPGACLLSKAMLCHSDADTMLAYIYENQEQFRVDGLGKRVDRIRSALFDSFPDLKECVDAPKTKMRLNKVLRFAVENRLPLLTPQLYIHGQRLCDEDTDLGLDYAMPRLLNGGALPEGSQKPKVPASRLQQTGGVQ